MLIALSLTVGMLAGCGGNAASSTAAESEGSASVAAPTEQPTTAPQPVQETEESAAERCVELKQAALNRYYER